MSDVRRSSAPLVEIRRRALAAVLIAVTLLPPFFAGDFWLQVGLFSMAAVVGAVGLSLLVGVAGQLSLGHAFFVAIGAYGYAYLAGPTDAAGGVAGAGLPPVLAMLVAVALAGLAGLCFSPIASRLRGIYLGLASLGLVFVGRHILVNAASISGGFNGRDASHFSLFGFGFADIAPAGLLALGVPFGRLERLWYLHLVIVLAACWFARNLVTGRHGRSWATMRDSEVAAGTLGIAVGRAKATAFTISSMYAGLGGVLTALAFGRIVPESFGLALSISFLVMIVIGGAGTVGGAAAGAVFVSALPLVLDRYSGAIPFLAPPGTGGFGATHLSRVLYGLAILVVLLFARGGLAGLFRSPGHRMPTAADGSPASPRGPDISTTDETDTSPKPNEKERAR